MQVFLQLFICINTAGPELEQFTGKFDYREGGYHFIHVPQKVGSDTPVVIYKIATPKNAKLFVKELDGKWITLSAVEYVWGSERILLTHAFVEAKP